MADGTPEPKDGGSSSWWATLPGVLTAIAGLLTAVAGLISALPVLVNMISGVASGISQARVDPPIVVPSLPPSTSAGPVRVEGIKVKITAVQRIHEQDATFIQLNYSVASEWELLWHDPDHFVRIVCDGATMAPTWTSPSAEYLPPNSLVEFSVKFRSPCSGANLAVFRFGEESYTDIKAEVADRKTVRFER